MLYASYLKDDFNVIAIAVSGEIDKNKKISKFLWFKDKLNYKEITKGPIIPSPHDLFSLADEQQQKTKEGDLIKNAIAYNKKLHDHSIPEEERCIYISSILVALQDKAFRSSYKDHHNPKNPNPNESLIKALLNSCDLILKNSSISDCKRDIILYQYERINQSDGMTSPKVWDRKTKKPIPNTILRDLIYDIEKDVLPYVNKELFDVLGRFYTQFIRYAGSDKKTGLVLTPPHITDFFCDISSLNENDIVFDPCCGTGGFLVSAMNRMLSKAENSNSKNKIQSIQANQIIGIERRNDMFSHVCSNMMMRGDGKSHIHKGDCFDDDLKQEVKVEKPTKIFLNPPYDVGAAGQLEFIENAMDCFGTNGGICVAICQMSAVLTGDNEVLQAKSRLLEKHTLQAVLSMPTELFHPVGVVTAIILFEANQPHPDTKETFFGYFKDDGFVKVKNKGRIDRDKLWEVKRDLWLDAFINRKKIQGLSLMQKVTPNDEWCAEAYMKTDYSLLTNEDFVSSIKNYVTYRFLNELNK